MRRAGGVAGRALLGLLELAVEDLALVLRLLDGAGELLVQHALLRLRALASERGRAAWAARSGLTVAELAEVYERSALVAHAGIGDDRAGLLERVGVRDRVALRRWTPEALAAALRAHADGPRERFLERRVRVWLR